MSQESILKVQPSGTFSNRGYINPDAILTGEDFGTISLRGEKCVYQATTLRSDGTYLDGRRQCFF